MKASDSPYPKFVSLGICPTATQGVVMANYSGRYSRMMTWDVESLEITGVHDLKAGCYMLDTSPDGKFCTYHAGQHPESYLAISKPPFFCPLFLTPADRNWTEAAYFGDKNVFHFRRSAFSDSSRIPQPKVSGVSPYRMKEHSVSGLILSGMLGARMFSHFDRALRRCSGNGTYDESLAWRGEDSKGRKIWTDGKKVFADDLSFIDLTRQPFEEVAPPDWATNW